MDEVGPKLPLAITRQAQSDSIYQENRERTKEQWSGELVSFDAIVAAEIENHKLMRPHILKHVLALKAAEAARTAKLQSKYKGLYQKWTASRPRLSILGKRRTDTINSEADLLKLIDLSAQRARFAQDPDQLGVHERAVERSFISTNGLVKDALIDQKAHISALEMLWSKEDRTLFKTALSEHGKNFHAISKQLKSKTTGDCVEYYYRCKDKYGFKKFIKRCERKRRLEHTEETPDQIVSSVQRATILHRAEKKADTEAESEEEMEEQQKPEKKVEENHVAVIEIVLKAEPKPSPSRKEGSSNDQWTATQKITLIKTLGMSGLDYQLLANATQKTVESCKDFYERYRVGLKLDEVSLVPQIQACLDANRLDKDVEAVMRLFVDKKLDVPKKKRGRKKAEEAVEVPPEEDEPKRTVSYWSVSEKTLFLKNLVKIGRNWDMLARKIGTKSATQCRNYYHNYKGKLGLDKLINAAGHGQKDGDKEAEGEIDANAVIVEEKETEPVKELAKSPSKESRSQQFAPPMMPFSPFIQLPKLKKQKTASVPNIASPIQHHHNLHTHHQTNHPQLSISQIHHQQMYSTAAYFQPQREYQQFYRPPPPPYYAYGLSYPYGAPMMQGGSMPGSQMNAMQQGLMQSQRGFTPINQLTSPVNPPANLGSFGYATAPGFVQQIPVAPGGVPGAFGAASAPVVDAIVDGEMILSVKGVAITIVADSSGADVAGTDI